MLSLLLFAFLLFVQALAQNVNCDFYQYVQPNQRYFISSPNYPNPYQNNSQCRWIGECPNGYQCRVDCVLEMPLSKKQPLQELPDRDELVAHVVLECVGVATQRDEILSAPKSLLEACEYAFGGTSGCSGDNLRISRTGDTQLNSAERYCGRQTLTGILSVNTQIVIGLFVTSNTPGGRFTCNLTAQVAPPPPCSCGVRRQDRIVGGTPAGVNEFTMMAGLIDRRTQLLQCGASILSERFILGAAHCLGGLSPTRDLIVSVGNRDLFRGIMFNVVDFVIHPYYNSQNYDFDVSILAVDRNIPMSPTVGPVCLPFKYVNMNLTGATVTYTGWGTTSFGGPTSPTTLLKADVRVISQEQCQRSMAQVLTPRQVCALTPGKDACQNDSGGPAQFTDPSTGRLFVVGIISFGVSCGTTSPGVLTRVYSTEILNWIVQTARANYCVVQ